MWDLIVTERPHRSIAAYLECCYVTLIITAGLQFGTAADFQLEMISVYRRGWCPSESLASVVVTSRSMIECSVKCSGRWASLTSSAVSGLCNEFSYRERNRTCAFFTHATILSSFNEEPSCIHFSVCNFDRLFDCKFSYIVKKRISRWLCWEWSEIVRSNLLDADRKCVSIHRFSFHEIIETGTSSASNLSREIVTRQIVAKSFARTQQC